MELKTFYDALMKYDNFDVETRNNATSPTVVGSGMGSFFVLIFFVVEQFIEYLCCVTLGGEF